jgi:gamma-glutamyltranspeptidase / glutathione hydrolase
MVTTGPDFSPLPTLRPPIMASRYVVASGHYLASMAGMRVLEAGGTVFDAGVAAGLCINVIQPDMTSLGGVAPIMMYRAADRQFAVLSGLGAWPQATTLDEIQRRGGDLTDGLLAAVVPAALDAWVRALDHFGTMPFGEVARPAIELAESGFPVNVSLHRNLRKAADRIGSWPSTREVFLGRGRAPEPGERLVQRHLARTLRMLAEAETGASNRRGGLQAVRDLFYRGPIARAIGEFYQVSGGLLASEDLAAFHVEVERPVRTTYRGFDVYACRPWCQGPVVLQALNILEGFDMTALSPGSAPFLHLVAEALKGAFADREAYYGDPRFVDVPIDGLLSKEYARAWRERIRTDRAWPEMPDPGNPWSASGRPTNPPRWRLNAASQPTRADTSYVCVLDAEGNAFSATPSDDATEAPLVPGLGFAVSARGAQSWLVPEHPSCLAPGKRPRLTPSPGLVARDGRTVMTYGTPGGDVQPQAMVQFLLHVIDHGSDVMEAIEAPRIATFSFPASSHPHGYSPGLLRVEGRILEATCRDLVRLGHRVESWPGWAPEAGALCAIRVHHQERTLAGGADPRRLAYAIGW